MRRRLVAAALGAWLAGAVLAAWQETEADRERLERVDELFRILGVQDGLDVADVGSADGFYSVRLARAVTTTGQVYAVDIRADVLERLRQRIEREGLANINIVQGTAVDPNLPAASVDLVLIRNAYHEMAEYAGMLAGIHQALRPDGVLAISEPIHDDRRHLPRDQQTKDHEIAPEIVEADLEAAGFDVIERLERFTEFTGDRAGGFWLIRARRR